MPALRRENKGDGNAGLGKHSGKAAKMQGVRAVVLYRGGRN